MHTKNSEIIVNKQRAASTTQIEEEKRPTLGDGRGGVAPVYLRLFQQQSSKKMIKECYAVTSQRPPHSRSRTTGVR